MLFKLSYLFPTITRHQVEKKVQTKTALNHQDWLKIDRIVITLLFLLAIIAGIVFA